MHEKNRLNDKTRVLFEPQGGVLEGDLKATRERRGPTTWSDFLLKRMHFAPTFWLRGSIFSRFYGHMCSPEAAQSQPGQSGQSFTDKGSRRPGPTFCC